METSLDLTEQRACVLIVDDERRNRVLLEAMLAPEGYNLITAVDGDEALAIVAQQSVDLILLDLMMPGRDGCDVARQLKGDDRTGHIPIIMITALDDRDSKILGLSSGAEDFLSKPVDRAELCMRVRNLLRLKAYGDYFEGQSRKIEGDVKSRTAHILKRSTTVKRQAVLLARQAALLAGANAGQLRFKDEFLSHVSHELRQPLVAIMQFTAILLDGLAGEANPKQRKYLEIILKNSNQLQAMIDDLLEVTRLETDKIRLKLESLSMADAVADALDTLGENARAKGISLHADVPRDLPHARADPTRLQQILIILLDNAIKFTDGGGEVSVHARPLTEDSEDLLIRVSDTGCGISPDKAERIFERHFQESEGIHSSPTGLGLGLYICKELVTRQGGRIWAKGDSPTGSTFFFTLPTDPIEALIAPHVPRTRAHLDMMV